MDMLLLSHLSKSFGKNKIIDDLTVSIPQHTIFGLIGKNGAGKTTTMKMILGLLQPDCGEIFVHGEKVCFGENRTNQYIGYLPDVPEFYSYMTPKEYLRLCGKVTRMENREIEKKSSELLELVGLETTNKQIGGFSRGMKQRLGIAQALLNSPKLLICDEPTSALDPIGRKEILDILSFVKNDTTVLFSTHVLTDIERICDEIAFLDGGKLALKGSLEEIRNTHKKRSQLEIECYTSEEAEKLQQLLPGCQKISRVKLCCEQKTEEEIFYFMQVLLQNRLLIRRMETLEPTLEELFIEVIRS